jgi:hypothetical protein
MHDTWCCAVCMQTRGSGALNPVLSRLESDWRVLPREPACPNLGYNCRLSPLAHVASALLALALAAMVSTPVRVGRGAAIAARLHLLLRTSHCKARMGDEAASAATCGDRQRPRPHDAECCERLPHGHGALSVLLTVACSLLHWRWSRTCSILSTAASCWSRSSVARSRAAAAPAPQPRQERMSWRQLAPDRVAPLSPSLRTSTPRRPTKTAAWPA